MKLRQIELFGYHGVFPEETKLGQKFVIDLEMQLDLQSAGKSDALEDTIDYAAVYRMIKNIVEGPPVKLIETLAEQIAAKILAEYDKVQQVIVQVTKPNPPFSIHFKGVTVEVERKRVNN